MKILHTCYIEDMVAKLKNKKRKLWVDNTFIYCFFCPICQVYNQILRLFYYVPHFDCSECCIRNLKYNKTMISIKPRSSTH
jgi:hypothetical protein